jgi:hypothetical protein
MTTKTITTGTQIDGLRVSMGRLGAAARRAAGGHRQGGLRSDRIAEARGRAAWALGTDGYGGYRTERSAGIHDNVRVKALAECSDQASLTCAIQELCAEKGVVAHVDIWTLVRSGKRQALCFVRTDRAAREERLAGAPGLTRFGNDLLFIVDLPAQSPNLL